ncbi:MAG TPA: hypothetical protein VGB63_11570 [Pedobacter sp.]|jgi:hypothetical protein
MKKIKYNHSGLNSHTVSYLETVPDSKNEVYTNKTSLEYKKDLNLKPLSHIKKTLCIFLYVFCLLTHKATAQIIEPTTGIRHNLGFGAGFDNNLIGLNINYAYHKSSLKSSAFIDFSQGSSLLGTGDFKTQVGLQTWQGSFKRFNLKNSIAFVYARSVNKAGNYTGLGLNIVSNPGVKFNRVSIGADFQYNPFLATQINHSEFYREHYYEDVKDGLYSSTAKNLRLGLYMAGQFGKKKTFELNIKGGYQNNGQYDKLIPNGYAIIGFNKSF